MIGQGLTLTVIGMAIVFLFLTLLVVLMTFMSRIVKRIETRRAGKASERETAAGGELGTGAASVEGEDEGYDYSEIAAALGAYLRAGGVLPAQTGEGREDIAAALAAAAAAGAPLPKGNYREIAAAMAAVKAYR